MLTPARRSGRVRSDTICFLFSEGYYNPVVWVLSRDILGKTKFNNRVSSPLERWTLDLVRLFPSDPGLSQAFSFIPPLPSAHRYRPASFRKLQTITIMISPMGNAEMMLTY